MRVRIQGALWARQVAAALSALPLVIACSAWSAGPGVARALGWEGLGR